MGTVYEVATHVKRIEEKEIDLSVKQAIKGPFMFLTVCRAAYICLWYRTLLLRVFKAGVVVPMGDPQEEFVGHCGEPFCSFDKKSSFHGVPDAILRLSCVVSSRK